jgi:hypothetical protein
MWEVSLQLNFHISYILTVNKDLQPSGLSQEHLVSGLIELKVLTAIATADRVFSFYCIKILH